MKRLFAIAFALFLVAGPVSSVWGSDLYADFSSIGIWKWNGTSWSRLAPENPNYMIASESNLYVDFATIGLWKWNGSAWSRLAPEHPQIMEVSGSDLYADFGAIGLWKWNGSAWSRLAPEDPDDIVVSGSNLYVAFPNIGLWKWNGTLWTRLAPESPEQMVVSGSDLYVDFGSIGLWKWNGTAWSRLAPENPSYMIASGSNLYVDFATIGLWKWNGTAWSRLAPEHPQTMVASGSDLYADFGAIGLWKWNGSAWSRLATENPDNIVVAGSDLYVDFAAIGLWKWNGSAWSRLALENPADMATASTSYSIGLVYLMYRNFENPANNRYQGYMQVLNSGQPTEASDVFGLTIRDHNGNLITPTSLSFWRSAPNYYYNCSSSPCTTTGPFIDSGYSPRFSSLPPDTYILEVQTSNGETVSENISYPGQLVLPFVSSATMQAVWTGTGDLTLGWTNPTTSANWGLVTQLRIVLYDSLNWDVLYVQPVLGDQTITIPASLINQIESSRGPLAYWEVQTRAYSASGLQVARGYSSTVTMPLKASVLTPKEISYLTLPERNEIFSLSGSSLINRGLNYITTQEILKAKCYFKVAAFRYEGNTSNSAQTAWFFLALTRVSALAFDSAADGIEDGLQDIGDVLDRAGYSADPAMRNPFNYANLSRPETLAQGTPRGADMQQFAYTIVLPELMGAVEDLNNVGQSFNARWVEPFDKKSVESDFGDVLAFRAALKAAIANILIDCAHNLDTDIAREYNAYNSGSNTAQAFLISNPNFGTLSNLSLLQSSKQYLDVAASDAFNAIVWIQAESDDQSDDYVNVRNATPEEINDAKNRLMRFRDSLNGPATIDGYITLSDTDDTVINSSMAFTGLNPRSFLPQFISNVPLGLLPNPTFGGVLINIKGNSPAKLNENHNGNSTADIIEIIPRHFEAYRWFNNSNYIAWDLINWDRLEVATGYALFWDVQPNVTTLSNRINTNSDWLIHSNLTQGVTYFYRIAAVTAAGVGPLSTIRSAYVW